MNPGSVSGGLTSTEVAARRARGEVNGEPPETGRTYNDIIRDNLFSFLNTTLFAIGLLLVGMGLYRDAVLSAGLGVINGLIGIVQEVIAKRRLDRITLLTRMQAQVMRDGAVMQIDPAEIVLGDLLIFGAGDQILVDGRIVGDGRPSIDESLLTGESDHVVKAAGDEVHAGTYCVAGGGQYVAEKVGAASLAAAITSGAKAIRTPRTPMQRDVDLAIRVLLLIAGAYLGLVVLGALIHDVPFQDTVLAAAVVVGIVPSGLFLMITITYSMATLRMAREDALVQQVNAVESLSNVDIFCMDKTGTLTANRLCLAETLPIGKFTAEDAGRYAGIAAACATSGNATSHAIAAAFPADGMSLLDEVHFSSARKWSGVTVQLAEGTISIVLGAPEMILASLPANAGITPPDKWRKQGWRVLLLGISGENAGLRDELDEPSLPANLQLVAWLAFSDELRPNLHETLDGFRRAGIELKIISGDNPETVAALAKQAGFSGEIRLVSGLELAQMSDAEFRTSAEEATIFGRITPDQKERLVRAMKDAGHYVAMTGDGVNDVLSLKQANLGIAMQSGSQATRASADIVLLNDSFAALPAAFREGQRIRNGLQSILELFLTRVFAVALVIAGVVVLQASFPFSPGDMTLLTTLTVGIPTFGLALWAVPGTLPRSLFVALIRFVVPASLMVCGLALGVYLIYYFGIAQSDVARLDPSLETTLSDATATARSALTTVMVLSGLWLVVFSSPPNDFWAVCEEKTGEWRPTILAIAMLPLFATILAVPTLRGFFGIKLLTGLDYVALAILAGVWGIALRYVWATRLVDRFFNVNLQEPASRK